MSVRIRLRRVGRKKQPYFRVVVAKGDAPRDGTYIDEVGFYNPRTRPAFLTMDLDKVDEWIGKGAEVSTSAASLIRKARKGGDDTMKFAKPGEEAPRLKTATKPERRPAASASAAEEAEAPTAEKTDKTDKTEKTDKTDKTEKTEKEPPADEDKTEAGAPEVKAEAETETAAEPETETVPEPESEGKAEVKAAVAPKAEESAEAPEAAAEAETESEAEVEEPAAEAAAAKKSKKASGKSDEAETEEK